MIYSNVNVGKCVNDMLLGCAEQGQLGRIAECFSNRGGRKGLSRYSVQVTSSQQFQNYCMVQSPVFCFLNMMEITVKSSF